MGNLTAAFVRSVTKPGRYSDGGTLFLRVTPTGTRSWIQRLVIDGKRHDIGLGGFPVIGLAVARERAFANRVTVAHGGDPLAAKQKPKGLTFRDTAERTYEAMKPRWRNEKTPKIWRGVLAKRAYPAFGDKPVDKVTREDVLSILAPIWATRPEVARRLRQYIRATLAWCQAHGHVTGDNVAGESIDGALPSMPSIKQHYRALPYSEVPATLEALASGLNTSAKLCLRFVILTAVRGGEARNAEWSEFDMEAHTWTIPAAKMKRATEHRVPLSDAALAVLEQARALDDGSGFVFPSPMKRGRPLSNMTLTKLLRDTGLAERCTVQGFRSSFRDWCAETGKPREIAEAALAHAVKGVEGAYFRSDLFERRRRLMDQWGAYVTATPAGKVVQIRG